MSVKEQSKAIKLFVEKWSNRGREDEDDRSYWIDLLQDVFGLTNVTSRIEFQKKVIGSDGNTKRIDVYIPETNVLIEQKSLQIQLDKPQAGHGGMTPYEQAKMYDNSLPRSEKSKWIVLSNFAEIWIYDMDTRKPEESVIKIKLENLEREYKQLYFLFDAQVEQITKELEVSQGAGEQIGKIYDALIKQYPDQVSDDDLKGLNLFCVRLVFCYYAEDAGLFEDNIFKNYMASFNSRHLRNGLKDLFRILNTPESDRDRFEEPVLLQFPYVNGGLFADGSIIIPQIDDEIKDILISAADFDWSEISPTIFGAIFESTLNQETRRSGGMHYTSIENIHKVIDPLFLDELKSEFENIKEYKQPNVRVTKLREFQNKLGSLKFFDPACGSGNFLTETYLSLRRLENAVIEAINQDQIEFADINISPIKVQLNQFYGIEINDFAVSVAKTALWIAENQMMNKTRAIIFNADMLNFLPLKSYTHIVESNALKIDWNTVVPQEECSYIMGNPPFRGHRLRNAEQIKDMELLSDVPKYGKVDYVGAWFYKASKYIQNTEIKVAFVTTNSLCQGESVGSFWRYLVETDSLEIQFAYSTFVWESEATDQASVHCIIVGFTCTHLNSDKTIYYADGTITKTQHINPYIQAAPDVFLDSRGQSKTKGMPKMTKGNEATDGSFLSVTPEERLDIIKNYPEAEEFIKPYIGSSEYINNKERYCIWLRGVSPNEYRHITPIMERLNKVKEFRANNVTKAVHKLADTPMLFAQIRQPETDYLLVPTVSSQRRKYIPMGFMDKNIIVNPKVLVVPDASLYLFGVLISIVHMSWMRVVTGRLKSDYEYYPSVYNNFPWPSSTVEQKERIEKTAKSILEARKLYPNSSLADLYDPLTMPPELVKAHQENDKAVMKAYGFNLNMYESDIVDELMKMYQEMNGEDC